MPKGDPVVIRWLDAYRSEGGEVEKAAQALRPVEIEETGWVVAEDDNVVVLGTGRFDSPTEGVGYRWIIAIPRVLIRSPRRLRTAR